MVFVDNYIKLKPKPMKRIIKMMVIAFVSTTLFLSCKKNDDEVIVYGNAKFNLINAVQGSAAQDFYQGDTKINISPIAYGEPSGYLTLKAGASTIFFKSAVDQTLNATENIGINTDVNYSVFYTKNSAGTAQIIGYPESNAQPPAGKAGVRFVNLGAALTSTVTVSNNIGEVLITSLTYGNITNYAVIDPSVNLKFSTVGDVNSTVIMGSLFQAGKLYTVWFDATNATTAQYHIVAQN